MIARALLLATALIAASSAAAVAQTQEIFANRNVIAAPVLRANVQVSGDLVRIGDVIDNAGSAAQIAIYRAPDLGTTGSLPVAQVLNTLRAHQVIGVDTRDLKEISVTRLARTLESKDIELQVARALERRNGLGDAANLSLTFDRDPGDVRLDAGFTGGMLPTIARYDNRNGRFDVTFEIANENGAAAKLRFTGTAIETVEGLASNGKLHPLQAAFADLGGAQCGYCTPGILMTAKALLDREPNPSRERIKEAISGNLCRCTGYQQIYESIEEAAKTIQESKR